MRLSWFVLSHGSACPCLPYRLCAVKVSLDPSSLAIVVLLIGAATAAVVRFAWPRLMPNALFVLEVKNGTVRTARGKPPARLVHDMEDVVRKPPVKRATIVVTADGTRARLVAHGALDEARIQRLRNVLGLYPLAKLR